MAGRSNILLKITGDTSEARRELDNVKRELRDLGKQQATAHVDIQIAAAERQLLGFRRQLQELSGRTAEPGVDLKMEGVSRKILTLEARLARLGRKRVEIDVDVRRGAGERTVAALGSIDRGAGRVVRSLEKVPFFIGRLLSAPVRLFQAVIEGFSGVVQAGGALIGFFARLGGAVVGAFQIVQDTVRGLINGTVTVGQVVGSAISAILSALASLPSLVIAVVAIGTAAAVAGTLVSGLVVALNALLGAIIALGGALVALVASLAGAVAGFGALAVAFGAALIPVALVAIAVFQRFQAVLKARQAHEQELAQAVQAQKTAEQQRKDALDASRAAHERLSDATVEGNRAIRDSIFEVRDAQIALDNARNNVADARLSVLDAKKALRDLLTQAGATGRGLDHLFKQFSDVHVDPTKLQGILGAVQGAGGDPKKVDPLAIAHAIQNLRDAQQGVTNAINQTAHAERDLAGATKKRSDFVRRGLDAYKPYRQALEAARKADERLAAAQDKTSAAQRKYERALKGLSDTEKGTLSRIDGLVKGFTRLAKALTDPIFRAFNSVLDSLRGKGAVFESALRGVGEALGGVVRAIGAFLTEPASLSAFQTMARGAAALVRELGARAFVSFLRIMREVAVSALPAVRHAARDVANALEGVASKPGRIHAVVRTLVSQFRTWARLAGSLIGLVRDIFVPASREGQSLADSMRHIIDRWRAWIRANPEKVREFFRTSVRRVKEIVHWLAEAASWLKNKLPRAAATAKRYLDAVAKVLGTIIDGAKWLGNARRNAEHFVTGAGSLSTRDVAATLKAINADVTTLHTHLSPEARDATRDRLIEALTRLQSHWVDIPQKLKELLDRLRRAQGHAEGGIIAGNTSAGDSAFSWMTPGEGIIKAAMVRQLGGPKAIAALNAGRIPVAAVASAGGDTHHHYHVPAPASGGSVDPRSTLEHIHTLVTLKAG